MGRPAKQANGVTNSDTNTKAVSTKYHHGDLHAAALNSARVAVAANGRGSLTMRSMATSLGVTHAALYRHYESIDALVDEVAAQWLGQLLVGDSTTQGNDTATQLVDRYVHAALAEPHLYHCAIESAAQRTPLAMKALTEVRDHAAKVFAADWPQDSTRVSVLRVMHTWGTMHGLLDLHRLGMIDLPDHQVANYILRTSLPR
jgi:AcrR family transcriptional regulator